MKKTYKLQDLDCANCAAKMERAISELSGVESATVSFMAQKLTIEFDENRKEEILKDVARCIRNVDPECVLLLK